MKVSTLPHALLDWKIFLTEGEYYSYFLAFLVGSDGRVYKLHSSNGTRIKARQSAFAQERDFDFSVDPEFLSNFILEFEPGPLPLPLVEPSLFKIRLSPPGPSILDMARVELDGWLADNPMSYIHEEDRIDLLRRVLSSLLIPLGPSSNKRVRNEL